MLPKHEAFLEMCDAHAYSGYVLGWILMSSFCVLDWRVLSEADVFVDSSSSGAAVTA